jgi:hypothetical protein
MNEQDRLELKSLTKQFEVIAKEQGMNDYYVSPDYKHIEEAFGSHADFPRWKRLHSNAVIASMSRGRFARY